jgi:NAD(P)-dependent dehydrogenase (short-subunit alcohol dehydrogenase family)
MAGKVVLITGGTGAIGKATAIGLATIGAPVGITGRDLARAQQAAADIRAVSGNPAVDMHGHTRPRLCQRQQNVARSAIDSCPAAANPKEPLKTNRAPSAHHFRFHAFTHGGYHLMNAPLYGGST